MSSQFNTPQELIEDIRNGKIVVLIDDEDRENEGDLVLAADFVTPETINFMAREARGLICLALSSPQIDKLSLPMMVRDDMNSSPNKTAFTVSIEASFGVTTGISAADRAHTIRVAASPQAKPSDVRMPGHIFPIRAQMGGVLRRPGHTEGSVDLATLAGLNPAAVICEVMNDDGSMARVNDLMKFAKTHNLKIGTIVDLIEYRLQRENLIEETYSVELPSMYGDFKARVFRSKTDGVDHLLLQMGEISKDLPTLVRVQIDSYTKDVFSVVQHGDSPLHQALQQIRDEGSGIFLLIRGAAQSMGLEHEIKSLIGEAPAMKMDQRDYGIGAQILRAVGVHKIRLISNRIEKRAGLKGFDLEVVGVVPLQKEAYEEEDRNRHIPLQ